MLFLIFNNIYLGAHFANQSTMMRLLRDRHLSGAAAQRNHQLSVEGPPSVGIPIWRSLHLSGVCVTTSTSTQLKQEYARWHTGYN